MEKSEKVTNTIRDGNPGFKKWNDWVEKHVDRSYVSLYRVRYVADKERRARKVHLIIEVASYSEKSRKKPFDFERELRKLDKSNDGDDWLKGLDLDDNEESTSNNHYNFTDDEIPPDDFMNG